MRRAAITTMLAGAEQACSLMAEKQGGSAPHLGAVAVCFRAVSFKEASNSPPPPLLFNILQLTNI